MRVTWLHILLEIMFLITAFNVLLEGVSGTSDPKSAHKATNKSTATVCTCSWIWKPVCGQNDKTYHNPCRMKCEGQKEQHEGLCGKIDGRKGSCPCPRHVSLVCGMNNKTYFNECLMKCAGQTKKHNGSCEAGPGESGAWPWEEASIQDRLRVRNESLDCVCGITNKNENELQGRIAGGVNATPYKYGWMTALRSKHGECGASIINDRMILTAAHCVVYLQKPEDLTIKPEDRLPGPGTLQVQINVHNRDDDNKSITKTVEKVFVHPGFIPDLLKGGWDYDIALLILNESLVFPPSSQNGFRPICTPKLGAEVKTVGETALVTGWGRTIPGVWYSAKPWLKELEVPIRSLDECRNFTRLGNIDNFICAGTLELSPNVHQGDSGSPLAIKLGEQFTQVGIASWGEDDDGNWEVFKYVALYQDLTKPATLQFIDYYAQELGVGWCRSSI